MPFIPDWVRQRKIVQWALAYLAISWVLYEALSLLSDNFAWPPAIIRAITVILGFGLLITLVIAWYHGERGRQRVAASEALILGVLVLLGVAAVGYVTRAAGEPGNHEHAGAADTNSIAVLPLESLSDDRDDAYFADGVHEEILTHLSRVPGLKVISRTSVLQFRERKSSLRDVAAALGVATVLEGSLRRDGDKVRVTAQLIDARNDEQLWADTYDGETSDVFEIQRRIAAAIVGALRPHLAPVAAEPGSARPTTNPEAYDLYLQARAYHARAGNLIDNMRSAEQLYNRAIKADPDFGLAYARLAHLHGTFYWFAHDRTPARLRLAKHALDRAIGLQPDLPETRYAAGFYYYSGLRDYDRAEAEFSAALRAAPGSGEVLAALAFVQRRRGEWERALVNLERAAELDPRHANVLVNLAGLYGALGRYREAIRMHDQVLAVAPDFHNAAYLRALMFIQSRGVVDSLTAVLKRLPPDFQPLGGNPAAHVQGALIRGDTAEALRALGRLPAGRVLDNQTRYWPVPLLAGIVHDQRGDERAARAAYDSARVILAAASARAPGDPRIHSALGYAYAGLGRRTDAVKHGRRATELLPRSKDALEGPNYEWMLAATHARLGDADAALQMIEDLLPQRPMISTHELRLDPLLAPLRKDPRFEQVLRRFGRTAGSL